MKTFIKYRIFYFMFMMSIVNACPHDTENMIVIQDQNSLENLLKNNIGPCLFYFYMNSCSWCSKMIPIIEKLAQTDTFCENITFYKVNGPQTKAQELINQYLNKKIPGYPTMFFINKGEIFDTQIGGTNESVIRAKLTALLKESQKK